MKFQSRIMIMNLRSIKHVFTRENAKATVEINAINHTLVAIKFKGKNLKASFGAVVGKV